MSGTAETDEGGSSTRVAGETPDGTTEHILESWEDSHVSRKWWVVLHRGGTLAFAMLVLGLSPFASTLSVLVILVVLFLGQRLIIDVAKRRARRDAGSGEYPASCYSEAVHLECWLFSWTTHVVVGVVVAALILSRYFLGAVDWPSLRWEALRVVAVSAVLAIGLVCDWRARPKSTPVSHSSTPPKPPPAPTVVRE